MPTTIVVVDDHPIFRQGLRHLLAKEKNLSIVGEAGDGRTAIDLVRRENPDIVVMDVSMPDIDGIEATRQILSELPDTKIVALSMHSSKQFIEGMIQAGASGYILKESVPEEMIQGIRTVLAGEVYLSASISGIVISGYKKLLSATVPAAETPTGPILRTKLQRPPLSSDIIPRPRLMEQLEKGRQGVMTLVSAPAGYGKSITVSQWLETCGCPAAWVSLDKIDSDLRLFLNYFVTAIQTISPDAVRKTRAMLDSFQLPPLSIVAVSLINELDRIEQPFILCLDDCHLIQNESVFELLAELLRNPPQSMHLILTSRRDLPLPFHMLRAQSRMTEIRTQELRFNLEETTTFLNKTLGIEVDPATSRALGEKTEGWVTGLRLAALTLKLKGYVDPRLLEPMVNAQYVMEYLFNEVFSHQPPEFNRYLLGTSILERFCAPLCDAVCLPGEVPLTCEAGGWKFLAWLKEENVFVNFLDDENRWFRYHHIFRKFLGNQLKRHFSSEDINALHAQASAWFAENGMIEEAFRHALAAGDVETAGSLVTRFGHDLMNDQQWPRLERLLGMLPRDHVEQDPQLLLFESWLLHIRLSGINMLNMQTWLEKVETLLHSVPQKTSANATQMKGHFDALRGFQLFMSAEGENALKHTRSACRNIPIHHHRARAFVHIFQTGAYQMIGDLETGLSIFNKEMERSTKSTSNYYAMYLACGIRGQSGPWSCDPEGDYRAWRMVGRGETGDWVIRAASFLIW